MKPKKSPKKLRITQADYMLAQRRAARMEEIADDVPVSGTSPANIDQIDGDVPVFGTLPALRLRILPSGRR